MRDIKVILMPNGHRGLILHPVRSHAEMARHLSDELVRAKVGR